MTTQSTEQPSKAELDRKVSDAFQKHRFGRFDDAFAAYSDVLRIMPEHEEALHYMGLLAQQSGKSHDAVKLIQRSLELKHDNPDALNHLGQVYIALDDFATAEQCFRQALAYERNHFHAINNLANCFKQAGNLKTALIHYERALDIEPRNPICLFNIGSTLIALGRHWDAIEYLTKATHYERNNFIAHHKLGVSFEQLGKFEEAQYHFQKALEYNPAYYDSLAALLNSPAYDATEEQAETARKALREGELADDTRIRLEHALGKYFDKHGDYERAYSHFKRSNDIQKANAKHFDLESITATFDHYIDFYTAEQIEQLAQYGSRDERLIFVVGMPRTGTSLTEQILASHTAVHGAGELKLMQKIEARLAAPINQGGLGGLVASESPLTPQSIDYLCRIYIDGLKAKSPDSAIRIVDKFPMNWMHLGLISILFPKAKIISCHRNPLDIAISCFTVLFKMENDFTNDLRYFGRYYKEYQRLMNHWMNVLPATVFEMNYEDTVAVPDTQIRKLIAFCDLPWEDACLRYEENARAVRTPSNWQVRQKMYSSSVGRWKNYEKFLADLKETLAT
jgi:tetratricopeptide (TPR) repeat protein